MYTYVHIYTKYIVLYKYNINIYTYVHILYINITYILASGGETPHTGRRPGRQG